MAPVKRKLGGEEAVSSKSANKRPKSDKTKSDKPSTAKSSSGGSKSSTREAVAVEKKPKAAATSILSKEQAAFPRGGAGLLTPIERKQIQAKASRDVAREAQNPKDLFGDGPTIDEDDEDEFGSAAEEDTQKTKKKSRKDKARKAGADDEPERRIGGLNYKRITTGSLILGQIASIGTRALTVALPNNLVGYVPLTAVSTQLSEKIQNLLDQNEDEDEKNGLEDDEDGDVVLSDYFRVGQYLRVAVTSTEQERKGPKSPPRKRIELSIDPALTNVGLNRANLAVGVTIQAAVISVEDHGLVVDPALEDDNLRGFIPKKELPPSLSLSGIKAGSVLLCSVSETGPKGKVIKLSGDLSKAATVKTAPSVEAFLPGTRAEVLIDNKTDAGLSGKVMGLLDVTADVVHSGSFKDKEAFLSKFNIGKKIPGRLICTFPLSDNKTLGFSVLDNLIDVGGADTQAPSLALSSTVDSASVIRVESGLGIYLQLSGDIVGFAHISRLSDKKVDSVSEMTGAYKLGSEHRARILDYNPVDGLYIVSLQPSVLEQPFLRIDDIPIGAVVKGTIEKLVVGTNGVQGLIINLAEGVTALVPQIHMSDVDLKNPERKFRDGQAVTARVLSTDPVRRRVRLTLKKTLVNSDHKAWSDFHDIEVGASTVGTLIKVDRAGAVVQFFGSVKGFLPVSEMSEAYIKDATEHFRVGQVLTVNAISVNADERRLTISCRDITSNPSLETSLASLEAGTLVNGTVFEKSQNDVLLRLEGSDAIARLTLEHVADGSKKKRDSAHNKIRVGQRLENLLVLQVQAKRRLVILSNKQSLVTASKTGTLLTNYTELQEGKIFTGFVSSITDDGVFVSFVAGISGLIPKNQVPVDNEEQSDFGMTKLQPITAKVFSIDYKGATPRFWLTMRDKPSPADAHKVKPTKPAVDIPEVVDPVDTSIKSFGDFSVGKITKARIIAVKGTQINVELAKDVQGRIDVSEVFDSWEEIKAPKRPLQKFSVKQELKVKVLGVHDTRNHKFLPLSHRTGNNSVFELSCKGSSIAKPEDLGITLQDVSVGSSWLAFVNNISDNYLWVNISPLARGRIRAKDVSDDLSLAVDLESNFPIGSALQVRVLTVDVEKNRLDLTAKSKEVAGTLDLKDISKGLIVPGRITKVSDHNIVVQLGEDVVGVVELVDMADDYDESNPAKFQKNEIIRACVVAVDAPNKKINLSVRPSKILSASMNVKDREITSIKQLTVNDVVRGFIRNVSEKGIFVTLGHDVTAFVRVSNLSDSFLKDWKDHFQRDQLVKGKVVLVDQASGHVQLSLKESVLSPDYKAPLTFHDLKAGDIITGKVAKVESFGVFILVDKSDKIRGLCHRSEIAEQRIEDVLKSGLFEEGDAVKAKVLKVDAVNRKINLGMKPSYFQDAADSEEDEESDEDSAGEGGADLDDEDMEDVDGEGSEDEDMKDIDDVDVDEDSEDEDAAAPETTNKGLSVGGFDWYGMPETIKSKKRAAEASESEDERATSKSSKKKKKRAEIQVDRTADLDTEGPQSADDYERLITMNPASSLLWLQYIAFLLQQGETDGARGIGERALKSMAPGQDAEKLNIWTVLLNLENISGDDDKIEAMFKRACEYNDPHEIYKRLTSIYIQSGKQDKADDLFQRRLKKFTQDPKEWVDYATFLFDTVGDAEKARALLPRALQALQSLPKSTYAEVTREITVQFARLEYKSEHGLVERGRTIFEGLISSFPKRLDLFDVLLDLELKVADQEQIRGLFERVLTVKLKRKQALHFFDRWIKFEEAEGDERRVDEVKARKVEWVEAH
jgi:rRNA biogenesis protein RRP5